MVYWNHVEGEEEDQRGKRKERVGKEGETERGRVIAVVGGQK